MRPGPGRTILLAAVAAVALLTSGCATDAELDMMIQEGSKGAVYLERIPDTKFQAAHPITLDRELIARTLRGVYVKEERSTLQSLFANDPQTMRAFNDSDVDYLAPVIVTALARAAADQRVGFRVTHPAPLITRSKSGGAAIGSSDPIPGRSTEITEANLYAYGTSLHLTLTKYRSVPERPDTINMPNRRLPDPTGMDYSEVFFYPAEARRPETHQPLKLLGEPHLTTLVIDYQLLAKLPASMLVPPQPKTEDQKKPAEASAPGVTAPRADAVPPPAPSAQDQQAVKQLESLKEEMEQLRRQMQQQQEEMEKLKEQKPRKKRPEGQP